MRDRNNREKDTKSLKAVPVLSIGHAGGRQGFTPLLSQIQKGAGFTLIEVLVTIFVVTVGIGGVFVLVQRSASTASVVQSQLVASYLAQEGIEIVRNIRDTNHVTIFNTGIGNWDDNLTSCSSGCEADWDDATLTAFGDRFLNIAANRYTYDAGTQTIFKREITIDTSAPDILRVSIEVRWADRGVTRSVTVSGNLYNWLNS